VLIADLKLSKEAESIVNGSNVVFLETNVAHWADLQRIITASKERFGDVPDVYVAGAGIFEPVRTFFLLLYSIANLQHQAPMYSTTKHALVGFTRSMGDLDTHEGVKVVTICPG
jgi:NAD(P)-dependent dehydrogenase (short-subunit alcohol dehydrogenase family)